MNDYKPPVMNVCKRNGVWVSYVTTSRFAYECETWDDLTSCRADALRLGCTGVVIGVPLVPWID